MGNRTPFQKLLIVFNLFLVLMIIAVGLDILVLQNFLSLGKTSITAEQQIERLEAEKNEPEPTPIIPLEERVKALPPVGIEIPSLNIFATVVNVELDDEGFMEVPKNGAEVGWYALGVRPGETGNAVMTAHYDTSTGKPAVFYTLRNTKPGDLIYVQMEGDEELLFQVDDVLSEPVDAFPEDLIFGGTNKKRLVLITCDGVWNPIEKNYSKRLVVFASLWENKTL